MNRHALAFLAALSALVAPIAAHSTDLIPSPLAGAAWEVVAIDGRVVEPVPADDNRPVVPSFSFGYHSYGGNAGCNALGGLYAQVGKRLYTLPGPQTEMACSGARDEQEQVANAVFDASPEVTRSGDTIELAGGGHTLSLRRIGAADNLDPPGPWQGRALDGQSFAVHTVNGQRTDGKHLWGTAPPRVRFSNGAVTMRVDCPTTARGIFVQGAENLHGAEIGAVCTAPDTRDAALARILGADPRIVTGPNGEMLLASHAGWAILWNERRDRPK